MIQEIIDIEKIDLLNKSLDMKNGGRRLAQICATKSAALVLLYSFVKEDRFTTLRFTIDAGEPVESISWLYPYAFLYENELKDLFGINILNMNIDFGGKFYQTAQKNPFTADEGGAKSDG